MSKLTVHTFQKISFLAVMLTLGVSAPASAQSFPQDYLNVNQETNLNYALDAEYKQGMRINSSFHDQVVSSSHSHNELKKTGNTVQEGKTQDKMMTMTDAKSKSSFHLFTQYL